VTLPPQHADSGAVRRVDGRVVRGTRAGQTPVAGQWVVLHRVGPDHAGPLDSTRTTAAGRFNFRYHPSGDTTALYFVSTSYGGVVYPSAPLRGPAVTGDDATLMVFDTTSGPVRIKIGGRHLIIGAAQPNGLRPVGEVYDLQNDSTVTVVARDTLTPVWTAHLPVSATNFQLNASGDLAEGAVALRGSSVGLFAPLSPGIRQVAFTYELPSSAFPLSIPLERPVGVLEVLVQESTAHVTGVPLRELAPVNTEGRMFRRLLGQDLSAGSVVRVDLPRVIGAAREKVYLGVAIVVLAAMVIALIVAARRGARRRPLATPGFVPDTFEPASQRILRRIATLDAERERVPAVDDAARTAYDAQRASLKRELAAALAEERERA
jgi:hypothetical protein